jgi:hypothetical protein
MSFAPETESVAKPEALLRVPVGLASPLWGLFAGAAMTGAAWWWMTRWARPQNLEALYGAAAGVEAVVEAETPVLAAVELADAVAQATPAAAPETVAEALIEAPVAALPVGGEAAPISPVLEALSPEAVAEPAAPEAKPKKKAAGPQTVDKPA